MTNIFDKWTLPPERDFGWKMKPLESAKTSFITEDGGVFKLTIEHDCIKGVTPQMLDWWFKNIGGEMIYKGKPYAKYLVWHPKDHIHWSLAGNPGKPIGPGSCFRIVEAFNRNMNLLIDSVERVQQLDASGIKLVITVGGIEIFSLHHEFIQNGNSTTYKSQMIVGTNKKLIGKVFNYCIRPLFFTKEMAIAWLQHNIEEVGNFEFFLPELYNEEMNRIARK